MQQVQEELKASLELAATQMKRHYDRYVDEAPAFVAGDRVFLEHKEIVTARPSHKLDWKRHGPFRIAEKLSDTAYRLELPETMRLVHPVFHVSHLVPYRENTVLGRVPEPPQPIVVDGEEEGEGQGGEGKGMHALLWG